MNGLSLKVAPPERQGSSEPIPTAYYTGLSTLCCSWLWLPNLLRDKVVLGHGTSRG